MWIDWRARHPASFYTLFCRYYVVKTSTASKVNFPCLRDSAILKWTGVSDDLQRRGKKESAMAMYDPTTDGTPRIARTPTTELASSQLTSTVSPRRQGLPTTADDAVAPIRVSFTTSGESSTRDDTSVQLTGEIAGTMTATACPSEIFLG